MTIEHHCQCPCGETTFTVQGAPIMRSICHCTFCQEFNDAPYADICLAAPGKVSAVAGPGVDYQKTSAAVQRGKCKACGKPAIEFMQTPLGKMMAIIPSGNFSHPSALPEPRFHGFYHRRKADADDALPKYSGYLSSQVGFVKHLTAALLKRD